MRMIKSTRISIATAAALVIIIAASSLAYSTSGQATPAPSVEQTPIILDYGELVTMPRTTVYADLYCYGALIDRGNWTGVKLGFVLEKSGLNQQAETVELIARDGYSITIPILVAMQDDVIIAYEKNGIALPEVTRLIIPNVNGSEWISGIIQIKLTSTPIGYWPFLKENTRDLN